MKKCKQVDEQNITLADLPRIKKFNNVETQYESSSQMTSSPTSPPPNPSVVQQETTPQNSPLQEISENVPTSQPVVVSRSSVQSSGSTVQNSRNVSSDEDIANQVTSSTPHLGTVAQNGQKKVEEAIPMEIQVQPEVQTQVSADVIPYEDQSVISNTTIATAEQEAQANMYLNEDPMISTSITCAGHSTAQVVPSEDRLIPVTNGYKCLVCRRIFPTEVEGLKHVKSTHSKTYHCSQCGRIFNNKGMRYKIWHILSTE